MFLNFQFLRKTHSQKSRYILQSVAIVYTLDCIVSWIYKQKDKAAVISYSPFTILSNCPFFGKNIPPPIFGQYAELQPPVLFLN